jgi:HopA1 effector protein family
VTFSAVARVLADQRFLDELWTLSESQEQVDRALGRFRATRRLYTRLHLGMPDPNPGVEDSLRGEDDTTGLVEDVRNRLGDRRRRQRGWTFVGPAPGSGSLLRRDDGLVVTASEGEYTWPDGTEESAATDAVVVYWPSLEPGTMPGWIWFTGQRFDDIDSSESLIRFYVDLDSDKRGALWGELMVTLDDRDLAFSSKILTKDTEPARPDSVVVYCRESDAAAVLTAITTVVPESARGAGSAGFGVVIGPGLSIAHPEADEDSRGSLGMQRSERIWQILEKRRDSFTASEDLHELRCILELQESRVRSILGRVAAGG